MRFTQMFPDYKAPSLPTPGLQAPAIHGRIMVERYDTELGGTVMLPPESKVKGVKI